MWRELDLLIDSERVCSVNSCLRRKMESEIWVFSLFFFSVPSFLMSPPFFNKIKKDRVSLSRGNGNFKKSQSYLSSFTLCVPTGLSLANLTPQIHCGWQCFRNSALSTYFMKVTLPSFQFYVWIFKGPLISYLKIL